MLFILPVFIEGLLWARRLPGGWESSGRGREAGRVPTLGSLWSLTTWVQLTWLGLLMGQQHPNTTSCSVCLPLLAYKLPLHLFKKTLSLLDLEESTTRRKVFAPASPSHSPELSHRGPVTPARVQTLPVCPSRLLVWGRVFYAIGSPVRGPFHPRTDSVSSPQFVSVLGFLHQC